MSSPIRPPHDESPLPGRFPLKIILLGLLALVAAVHLAVLLLVAVNPSIHVEIFGIHLSDFKLERATPNLPR